jgi:hypothetical protein
MLACKTARSVGTAAFAMVLSRSEIEAQLNNMRTVVRAAPVTLSRADNHHRDDGNDRKRPDDRQPND